MRHFVHRDGHCLLFALLLLPTLGGTVVLAEAYGLLLVLEPQVVDFDEVRDWLLRFDHRVLMLPPVYMVTDGDLTVVVDQISS